MEYPADIFSETHQGNHDCEWYVNHYPNNFGYMIDGLKMPKKRTKKLVRGYCNKNKPTLGYTPLNRMMKQTQLLSLP